MKKLNKVLTSLFMATALFTSVSGYVAVDKHSFKYNSTYMEGTRVPDELH